MKSLGDLESELLEWRPLGSRFLCNFSFMSMSHSASLVSWTSVKPLGGFNSNVDSSLPQSSFLLIILNVPAGSSRRQSDSTDFLLGGSFSSLS